MENQIILLLVSFLITFQLLLIGLFLFTSRKGKIISNRLLGIIFFLLAWNFGDLTRQVGGFSFDPGPFQFIDDLFILLYGPLFYLYVQLVIFKNYKIHPKFWLHLLPYFLFTGLLIFPNTTSTESQLQSSAISQIIGAGLYVHVLTYIVFGFKSLNQYRAIIKNLFSQIDEINLNWLDFALKSFSAISVISLVHNVFVLSGSYYMYSISIFILLLFMLYFVNQVILKALHQPEIFAGIDTQELEKYSGSKLTEAEKTILQDQLNQVLSVEKLYRNPKLTMQDLSDRLGVHSKILSQVINQCFQRNFFDLINSYRIEEAKQILGTPEENRTILEVLYQVGFNSKSSFNTAFKKETGSTPTEFRQKNL